MPGPTAAPTGDHLEIKDSRTGKTYTVPITDDTIRTADLRQIKVKDEDFGMMGYDPAFMNTASCRSAITFIDGDKGILRYRGYPIEQLAEKASFLEVAWLLRHGELPTQKQYDEFTQNITYHTYVHENIKQFMEGFRYDAHPMSMLTAGVAALSSFYPTAKNIQDPVERDIAFIRLLAKMPTIAAFAYRHVKGLPYVYPDNSLPYAENFLSMIARMSEPRYEAHPAYARAIDVHIGVPLADHPRCADVIWALPGGADPRTWDLDALEGDNLPFAVDFRSLYATVLERWWGVDAVGPLRGRFAPLDLVRA